ncbi:Ig-like domain repeat protein [Eubacteriales bacterium OttesenSCG-928-A19]|nr:Ig-like domain repeat protein [Eubacteriales bacterium OttesenSCG-928-A19]
MKKITNYLRKYVAFVLMGVMLMSMLSVAQGAEQTTQALKEPLVCTHTEGGDPLTCEACIAQRAALSVSDTAAQPSQGGASMSAPWDTPAGTKATSTTQATREAATPLTTPTSTAEVQQPSKPPEQVTLTEQTIPRAAPGNVPVSTGQEGENWPAPEGAQKVTVESDQPTALEETKAARTINVVGLSCSPAHPVVGDTVLLTASLEGVGIDAAPAGKVSFTVDGETISASVTGSSASVSWQPESAGNFQATAKYAPASADAYVAGGSNSVGVTVQAPAEPQEDPEEALEALLPPAIRSLRSLEATTDPNAETLEAGENDLSAATVEISGTYVYTGEVIVPTYSVSLNGVTLTPEQDYSLKSLDGNTEAGTATLTVEGKGDYTGVATQTFEIQPASASEWNVTFDTTSLQAASTPAEVEVVSVTDGNNNVVDTTDYSLSYSGDRVNAGTFSAVLTPTADASNYVGASITPIALLAGPVDIDGATAVWAPDYTVGTDHYYILTGASVTPVPTSVKYGTSSLVANTDYTIGYANNTAAGTGTATLTGTGNYTGTKAYTFKIVSSQGNWVVTPSQASYAYTGAALEPTVTVTDSSAGNAEVNSSLYTVSYADNTNAGTARIIVTANAAPNNVATGTFTITKLATQLTLTSQISGGILTVYARVTGGMNPTGTVDFAVTTSSGSHTYTVNLSNGQAAYPIAVGANTFAVTATYSGDTNHVGSSASLGSFNVPNIRVSVTGGTVNSQNTVINVSVSGAYLGVVPTGTVILRLDGVELARLTLDRYGQASYRLSNYTWGGQYVTAEYLGDSTYVGAISANVPLWDYYKKIPTVKLTTSVGSGSNPTTLTASVSGYLWYEWPTGEVSFYNGERLLGTVALNRNGEATYSWRSVPTGTHTIYAVYSGDNEYRSMTATAKVTKRGSSSGGSSSGSGSGTANTTENVNTVVLRDANGNVLTTYDTASIQMQNGGVLPLETTQTQDYYSYSFDLPRVKQLASNQNGYFNLITPSFNFHLPYSLPSSLTDLSQALQQAGVTEAQTELRVNIRKVSDSALEEAFRSAHDGASPKVMYRVELALYSTSGTRLSYSPTGITAPVQLLVPVSASSGIVEGYDEQTRSFFPTTTSFEGSVANIGVTQSGIYIVGE